MKITDKTLYAEIFAFEDCLTADCEEQIERAIFAKFPTFANLTIKQLFEVIHGDFSAIGLQSGKEATATALQGIWIRLFKKWLDEFIKMIESLSIPATAESRQAAEKCLKQKFEESVLIFLREYFGLHSFNACYDLTITDYILAKRDAYNKAVFERAFAQLTAQKIKK